jgi:hypothetical protein
VDFENTMRDHFALAPSTLETHSNHASYFLDRLAGRWVRLRDPSVKHIQRYFDGKKGKKDEGWALSTRRGGSLFRRSFLTACRATSVG